MIPSNSAPTENISAMSDLTEVHGQGNMLHPPAPTQPSAQLHIPAAPPALHLLECNATAASDASSLQMSEGPRLPGRTTAANDNLLLESAFERAIMTS